MTEKPEPKLDTAVTDFDGSTYYEEWSQTNESELAEWIAEDWEEISG